jgi:hypothetical protein
MDFYMKAILTVIAICLVKIAFFDSPRNSYAQFPLLSSSDEPLNVNIKSIGDYELIFLKNNDLQIGGKKGPKIIEGGALLVRMKKG